MSLLSTHKSSDSGLIINLHPLILLTISDYITRHTLRQHTQPIVGALLGQQTGRTVSLEHAFEVLLEAKEDGQYILHEAWFKDRLQQYKDVHQAPLLDLVGWFTTAPATGPEAQHLPIHKQILEGYNETAVVLAFHPSGVLEGKATGGKLPLTIYESVYESAVERGGDAMDTGEKEPGLELRFRELPYSIETGEAEMISVDFVARGGGNATAVDGTVKAEKKPQASQAPVGVIGENGDATKKEAAGLEDSNFLSPEDEELIASLTARANAIKMLHTRIKLLKSYLTSLPPSDLTTPPDSSAQASTPSTTFPTEVNYPLLRSIQALLTRLPLLLPAGDLSAFQQETTAEKSDVELVSLLGSLGQSVKEAREMGRKFAIIEGAKNAQKQLPTFSRTFETDTLDSMLAGPSGDAL